MYKHIALCWKFDHSTCQGNMLKKKKTLCRCRCVRCSRKIYLGGTQCCGANCWFLCITFTILHSVTSFHESLWLPVDYSYFEMGCCAVSLHYWPKIFYNILWNILEISWLKNPSKGYVTLVTQNKHFIMMLAIESQNIKNKVSFL